LSFNPIPFKEERYGLTSQIRRSVVSISSNIEEEIEEKQPWITLENKPSTPRILEPYPATSEIEPSSPTKLEKNL
jgi:hypothetical protein